MGMEILSGVSHHSFSNSALHISQNLPVLLFLIRYESVDWLIATGQDEGIQAFIDCFWADVTLEEFKQAREIEEADKIAEKASLHEDLGKAYRLRFFNVLLVVVLNQFSGNATTFALARYVFPQVVGVEQSDITWAYVQLTFLQVVVTFITGRYLEQYGRKAFLLEGMKIMAVANILIALIEYGAPSLKTVEYSLIFVHMLGFSMSFGPTTFMIGTETFPDITYHTILLWSLIFGFILASKKIFFNYGVTLTFSIFAIMLILGILYFSAYLI
jgi:predicted MFS family arabinose efflux permease